MLVHKKCVKLSLRKLKQLNKYGVVEKNKELKNLTTFKIGGNATYYLEICTIENLIKVLDYLEDKNAPIFILGGGSNVLFSSSGYKGVVIKLSGDFAKILIKDNEMEVGAGAKLTQVLNVAIDNGLSGLEESVGIPASVGGAVYMNAQAYGFEMSKIVDYVVAYRDKKIEFFSNEECKFGYRDSVFKTCSCIILRVGLKLQKDLPAKIRNSSLETMKKRKSTQPLDCFSAGCVFKRMDGIIVSQALDKMGIKGLSIGGAKVSEKHANFIINANNATSDDVLMLINQIQTQFYKLHKRELSTEIVVIGDN